MAQDGITWYKNDEDRHIRAETSLGDFDLIAMRRHRVGAAKWMVKHHGQIIAKYLANASEAMAWVEQEYLKRLRQQTGVSR